VKVLALETSSTVASVALVTENKLMAELVINHKKTHSQMLMPVLENLLDGADLTIKNIDVFAVASGPGSFTGIRIGVATAKALAQALDKPVVGVSSLDGLAFNMLHVTGLICPLIDARNEQVYTCLYRSDGEEIERINDYMAIRVADLLVNLKKYGESIMFCGDAAHLHTDMILHILKADARVAQPIFSLHRASSIGWLALKKAILKETQTYSELLPFYLRKSQAEQKYEARKLIAGV